MNDDKKPYCMSYNELESITRHVAYKNANSTSGSIMFLFELARHEPNTWISATYLRKISMGKYSAHGTTDNKNIVRTLGDKEYIDEKMELYTPNPKIWSKRKHRFYRLKPNKIEQIDASRPDAKLLIEIMEKIKIFNQTYNKTSAYVVLGFLAIYVWRVKTTSEVGEFIQARNENKYSTHYKIITKMQEMGFVHLIQNRKAHGKTYNIIPIE